jgi:hypothetical protein
MNPKRQLVLLLGAAFLLFASPLMTRMAWADLNDGLVGHWTFDNSSITDSSGHANDGTKSPDAYFVAGYDGKPESAIHGGTFRYGLSPALGIYVPDSPSLSFTGNMTLSLWVNQDTPFAGGSLVRKYTGLDNHYSESWQLSLNDGNYPYINGGVFGEGSASDRGMNRASDNSMKATSGLWYHIAFVYTTDFSMGTYVNGIQQDESGYLGVPTYNIFDGDAPVEIGDANFAVDEVRIYSRALSPQEISQLATVPEPTAFSLLTLGALWFLGRRPRGVAGAAARSWKEGRRSQDRAGEDTGSTLVL